MKKIMGTMLLLALVGGMAFAGDPGKKTQTVNGYLVDVACQMDNASHPEPGFAAKHDKGCLQMAECVQSGYGILTDDNKFIKFDKASNEAAKRFIDSTDKKDNWKVSATGTMNGSLFTAQSLKLQ